MNAHTTPDRRERPPSTVREGYHARQMQLRLMARPKKYDRRH